MRIRSLAGILFATLILFLTGGPTSLAQNEDSSRYPFLDQRYSQPSVPRRAARPYPSPYAQYGTRYRAQPYEYRPQPQPPSDGGFFFPWSRPAAPEPAPQPEQRYYGEPGYGDSRPSYRRPSYAEPREFRRRRIVRPAPAPPVREAVRKPKPNPSTVIAVFGDSLADLVGQGLDDAFDEARRVLVVRRTRADGSLVRNDLYDWPKTIEEYLKGGQKVSFAVVMIGANDHQAIREGEVTHEPLSDRWKELYRDRVDTVVRAFTGQNVSLVWVGAPPMKDEKLSADMMTINEIARDRVQRGGGAYVDIWAAFVDDQNHYSAMGPNVSGQVARLRLNDGVQFTRAGARKAAHFAEVELRRLMDAKPGADAVAKVNPADQAQDPAAAEKVINAATPAPSEAPGVPSIAPKPVAGPVLPLTRADVAADATLVSARPRLNGEAASMIDRAFREGAAPAPKPGRADDFRWPPS